MKYKLVVTWWELSSYSGEPKKRTLESAPFEVSQDSVEISEILKNLGDLRGKNVQLVPVPKSEKI